jgi:hypothetical protein
VPSFGVSPPFSGSNANLIPVVFRFENFSLVEFPPISLSLTIFIPLLSVIYVGKMTGIDITLGVESSGSAELVDYFESESLIGKISFFLPFFGPFLSY